MRNISQYSILILLIVTGSIVVMFVPERLKMLAVLLAVGVPILLSLILIDRYRLLLVVVVGAGLYSPKMSLGFANLYLHQLLILLATLSMVLSSLGPRSSALREAHRLGFPLLAIGPTVSLLLSFPMAPDKVLAIKIVLFVAVLFCAYAVARNALSTWARVRTFARAICLGGTATALVSLFYVLAGAPQVKTSILLNPNVLGNFLALPAGFWMATRIFGARLFRRRIFEGLGISLMLLCILLAQSRASWLGLGMMVLAALLIERRFRLSLLALFALAGGVIFIAHQQGDVWEKLGPKGWVGVEYRARKIDLALEMFADRPLLGNGPGSFQVRASHHPDPAIQRHVTLESTYPYLLAEFGVVGILAWLFSGGLAWRMWRRLPRKRSDPRRILGNAVGAVVMGMLVVQIGENTLFFPKINWLLGALLGLLSVLGHLSVTPQALRSDPLYGFSTNDFLPYGESQPGVSPPATLS